MLVMYCMQFVMFKLFHTAPYAVGVELKNYYLFVLFVLEVFCLLRVLVWGCEGLGWVLLGWRRMEVCVMGICGESRDV